MSFQCDCCGCCCRNLDKSALYEDLDRGDGTCKYLNGNLCSIYETRPLKCRIDESYRMFFSDLYDREEYEKLNMKVCRELKQMTLIDQS